MTISKEEWLEKYRPPVVSEATKQELAKFFPPPTPTEADRKEEV